MKKKKLLIGIGVIILAVAVFLFFKNRGNKSSADTVDTMNLEISNIESHIKSSGNIVSMDKREVTSDVEEKIEKMFVKKGDMVKKDQVLMKLDESNIRYKIKDAKLRLDMELETLRKLDKDGNFELEMNITNLNIKYEDSKKEYERNKILFESGAINQVELDRSKDSMVQANNDYILAQDRLKNSSIENEKVIQEQRVELARIELEKLEKEIGKYVIKSPISGTIVDTNISEAGIVQSHTSLMSIQDITNLELVMNMNEYDAGKVELGNPVKISGDSLQGNEYSGKIKHIGSIVKPSPSGNENIVEVKISIDGVDKNLKPGLSAKVDILIDKKEGVFTLPYEAIFTNKDSQKLVYIIEGGKIKEIPIKTGLSSDFKVEVLGELKEGMEVILNPTEEIEVGKEVVSNKEINDDKNRESL